MNDARTRVLYSVPPPSAASNPYTTMLANGVAEHLDVDYFSWRGALLRRHDVLHVHWPETMIRAATPLRRALRQLAGHLYLTLAQKRGVVLVRTVHNKQPHEPGSRLERAFLARIDAMTVHRVFLSPTEGSDASGASVIPHGHYRDWGPYSYRDAGKARRLLLFGALRRYKGIETAIDAFRDIPQDASATFLIAGGSNDHGYGAELRAAATRDGRIELDQRRVPDGELAQMVSEAACVVLPYRDFYNSGAALLALSCGTHILAPRTPSSTLLLEEFGPEWVSLYDDDLLAANLLAAIDAGQRVPPVPPAMAERGWPEIVGAHVALYRRLSEGRR